MQPDPLAAAVRQCPFLAKVGAAQGELFARSLAANPFVRANASSASPVLLEEEGMSSFAATLKLFHGPSGVVPLKRFDNAAAPLHGGDAAAAPRVCPFRGTSVQAQPAAEIAAAASACSGEAAVVLPSKCGGDAAVALLPAGRHPLARAPLASMSLSGFGFLVSKRRSH